MSERPSLQQLESELEQHKQTIRDLRTLTALNIQAFAVNSSAADQLRILFADIERQIDEKENHTFGLLVAEQIREEDVQLRRERMMEYEDLIQERRRAVADKQGVYHAMTTKKRTSHSRYDEADKLRQQEKHKQSEKHLRGLERDLEDVRIIRGLMKQQQLQMKAKNQQLRRALIAATKIRTFLEMVIESEELFGLLQLSEIQKLLTQVREPIVMQNQEPGAVLMKTPDQTLLKCVEFNKKLLKQLQQQTYLAEYLNNENTGLIQRYKELMCPDFSQPKQKHCWQDESTNENA